MQPRMRACGPAAAAVADVKNVSWTPRISELTRYSPSQRTEIVRPDLDYVTMESRREVAPAHPYFRRSTRQKRRGKGGRDGGRRDERKGKKKEMRVEPQTGDQRLKPYLAPKNGVSFLHHNECFYPLSTTQGRRLVSIQSFLSFSAHPSHFGLSFFSSFPFRAGKL